MSYEVIARRWRPQDFTGLVGQDHVRTTLLNALKNNRLHHALLLTGPRGTGKTSTARILAKALRCPNAVDFVPCNQCSECEEITSGRSLNVMEIDGASNNGVDAIRELRETVGYLPSSGKYKMYIIDEVHMLSTSAFNALLKTLEEPPGHVYFVMATTESHKIPNTILSRVQRFDFRRIPTRVIAGHLQTICERDGVKFEPEALWVIARQGDGSMRDAQSLLDQVINFTGGELRRDLVVDTLGLTDRSLLNDLLSAVVGRQMNGVLASLEKLHQSGGDPKLFLIDFMEQIRNTLLIRLSDTKSPLVDLPDSEREALTQLGSTLLPEDLHLFFDMALKGAQDLSRASDPLLVLEMVLMRMTTAPRVEAFAGSQAQVQAPAARQTQSAAPARLNTLRTPTTTAPTQPAPAPAPAPTNSARTASPKPAVPMPPATTAHAPPPPTAAAPPATKPQFAAQGPSRLAANSPVELRFKELVEKIKEVNGLVGAQLENGFVVKLEGKEFTLGVSNKHKFLFDKMNQPDFKKKVLNYMNTFWGPGHDLQITLSEQSEDVVSPKALNEKMQADQRQTVRKAVEAHPLMQSTQSVFKTEIKSIKELTTEIKES